jgi:hypothetical protein
VSPLPSRFRSRGGKPAPDQDALPSRQPIPTQHPAPVPGLVSSGPSGPTGNSETQWAYPIYLVADTGAASLPAGWNAAVTGAGDAFLDEMIAKPETGESIYFGSLLHASGLWTSRRLSPASAGAAGTTGAFSTSYESLFRQLSKVLADDAARLTAAGMRTYMPLVIIAVGTPPARADSWSVSWRELVVDDEVESIGDDVARALVVPVCVNLAAEAACRELIYPQTTSHGYRAEDVSTLRDLLVRILTHAAQQLAALPATDGQPVLPDDDAVAGLGSVIRAAGLGIGPTQLPCPPITNLEVGRNA